MQHAVCPPPPPPPDGQADGRCGGPVALAFAREAAVDGRCMIVAGHPGQADSPGGVRWVELGADRTTRILLLTSLWISPFRV